MEFASHARDLLKHPAAQSAPLAAKSRSDWIVNRPNE
jgi:hypothetical protein